MDPIDYQSPSTAKAPVPPEHLEETYGCFPAVLAIVLAVVGFMLMCVARAWKPRWAMVACAPLSIGSVAGAWAMVLTTLRSPRGFGLGIVVAVAVVAITIVTGCAALMRL